MIEVDIELSGTQPRGGLNVPDAVNSGLYGGKVTNYGLSDLTPIQKKVIENLIDDGQVGRAIKVALEHNTNPAARKALLNVSARHKIFSHDYYNRGILNPKDFDAHLDRIIDRLNNIL